MTNRQQTTAEYESPRIDFCSVAAEAGFAQSTWNDGTFHDEDGNWNNNDFSNL